MSVDHKMFVACSVKNAMEIYTRLLVRLETEYYARRKRLAIAAGLNDEMTPYERFVIQLENKKILKTPYMLTYDMECINFIFNFGYDSPRTLFSCTVASCDYREWYDGEKITFSIGSSGDHNAIMEILKEVLLTFGDVYECDEANGDEFTKYEQVA